MNNIRNSVAFRLALVCGGLVIASVLILSAAFYLGTVTLMARNIDAKIYEISHRFENDATENGVLSLARRIEQTLIDGVDSDAEILLLINPEHKKIAGNIEDWPTNFDPYDKIQDRQINRNGYTSESRLLVHAFKDGTTLVVGRDMQDLAAIRSLIERAVFVAGALAILLAIGGTLVFRRQIEGKIGSIRLATADIESGNLSRRIQVSGNPDEFGRLSADINRMLDTIQHLMEGVRHISNTIAHNLRTPLGLIRGRLEQTLRQNKSESDLISSTHFAIDEIDNLIVVLEKLLQLAETESGAIRQPFDIVNINEILTNLTELYDAAAEAQHVKITLLTQGNLATIGDRDLIATMLANLLDNSLKYAGQSANIGVSASEKGDFIEISVQDDGPGIPLAEHSKVLAPFYRLDRSTRGSGLGLSIVSAITELHHGELALFNADPGLKVVISLPAASAATLQNGNL